MGYVVINAGMQNAGMLECRNAGIQNAEMKNEFTQYPIPTHPASSIQHPASSIQHPNILSQIINYPPTLSGKTLILGLLT